MSIYEIRKRRLNELRCARFDGSQKLLAEALGVNPNYISRILSDTEHRKTIGEKFARSVEQRLNLPHLWMDQAEGTPMGQIPILSAQALDVAIAFEMLSSEQQQAVRAMLKAFVRPGESDETERSPALPPRGPRSQH